MNPYEVLGVPNHATDHEIKKAYRRLVKQFHPDKNTNEDAKHRVVLINAAYEILSDPVKRAQYDHPVYAGFAETTYEEDPVEAYKREFKRKRWEKGQLAKQKRISREKKIQRVMRILSFPILVFACVLALDELLPRTVYDEIPLGGWQERSGSSRRNRGELESYIQTDHFYFNVPHELHLTYQYYDPNKPPIRISATPIFKVPRNFTYTLNENYRDLEIEFTIHNHVLPFPWLLLLSSIFVVANKSYTLRNYSLCFLPLLFLGFTLLIMW